VCLTALLAGSLVTAKADLIDFEAQGAGAPPAFTGVVNSPLVIGIATFTGGQLLNHEAGQPDTTAVYATTNLLGGAYTNPMTITFSKPVSGFSILVTNPIADTYRVSDNLGGSQSFAIATSSSHTFALAETGITSVSVSDTTLNFLGLWDFAIDNVQFTPVTTSAVPDPSASLLLVSALGLTGILGRRRRA
jgi:hypothetical protein